MESAVGYQRHHFGHLRITGSVATKERTQKLVDEEKKSYLGTMEYQRNYGRVSGELLWPFGCH